MNARARHPKSLTWLLTVAALCAACSKAPESQAAEAPPVATAAGSVEAQDAAARPTTEARMVIRSASLEVRADDPRAVIEAVTKTVSDHGGFIAHSDAQGIDEALERISVTLRIPADRFETTLTELRGQGELLHEEIRGEDVTDHFVDLQARLTSQKTLETRLLHLLEQAPSVEDAISIERHLAEVRTMIESLEGESRQMSNKVALATVELSVVAPVQHAAARAETVASQLGRALDDARRLGVDVLAGLIRLFGVLIPLGALGFPLVLGIRRLRRRSRARAVAAAQAMPHGQPHPYPHGQPRG